MSRNSQNAPLIETVHLKKYFDTDSGVFHAVDDVNLTIGPQKTLGVVGGSGCGKSTLGRATLRLTSAIEGKVLRNGKDILSCNLNQLRELRKEVQIISQDPYSSLSPRMTTDELIAEPLMVNRVMENKVQLQGKVAGLVETVGLAPRLENTCPRELDGGGRQRIGIARTLSINPEFIICDEPVSTLDVFIQAQTLNLLMDLQNNMGLTCMSITHDLSMVRHTSDEIAVIYLGQYVERCEPKELFGNPIHPYTKVLLDVIQVPDVLLRGKRKLVIHGEVASPIDPKLGCRFATHCPLATDGCWSSPVPLRGVNAGHFAIYNLI